MRAGLVAVLGSLVVAGCAANEEGVIDDAGPVPDRVIVRDAGGQRETGGDGSTPPLDGTSTPPLDGTSTPPLDGTSTPPLDGTSTPPRDGAGCVARELCGNGLDDNCDGRIDEGCACAPGAMQRCYDGPPGTAERGSCAYGMQRCEGTGEFGTWGACAGAVGPAEELCDGMDNDCDGMTDEGLTRGCHGGPMGTVGVGLCREGRQVCEGGRWGSCAGAVEPTEELCDGMDNDCDGMVDEGVSRPCYTGPPATRGRGVCREGRETCAAGRWSGCVGEVLPRGMELCGNGMDDDCDGMVDEGCMPPCIMGMASGSPWQVHRVMGPVCFGRRFSVHGEAGEYELARIPPEVDGGWRPVPSGTIDFSERSALCGRPCNCLDGGEFTYFQTFFDVSPGYMVTSLAVTMAVVDDGARVTVFNSRYPTGVVDPGSYVFLGGSGTRTDLARYVAPGRNRVVITHIDDCCSERYLTGVRVVLNGAPLQNCR